MAEETHLAEFRMAPSAPTRTLAEQIAATIAVDIVHSRFSAGEKLSEAELAKRFGVSRGPVRDALDLLERNMLVAIKPRCHTRVNRLTVRELGQLFTFRSHVLGIASRYAAKNRSDSDLQQLQLGMENIRESLRNGVAEFAEHNYLATKMWDRIISASHSHVVSQACMHFTGGNIWGLAVQDKISESELPAHGLDRVKLWENLHAAIGDQNYAAANTAGETLVINNWKFLKPVFQRCFPDA